MRRPTDVLEVDDLSAVAWSRPCRRDTGGAIRPLYGAGEVPVLTAYGSWAHADVYGSGLDPTWIAPPGGGTLTIRVYALVGGSKHLLATWPNVVLFLAPLAFYDIYLLAVRGRVCDGYIVTIEALGGAGVFGTGTLNLFAWGHEADGASTGSAVAPASVAMVPAVDWGPGLVGVIPPVVGPVIGIPINSGPFPAERYVDVSADIGNAGIVYVASGAVAAAAAEYQLAAGDSVRIEIDDAAKVFVLGDTPGDTWRAAVV